MGGGNIGSALAYGLAGMDFSMALLDQGKGLDMPRNAEWSQEATTQWPAGGARATMPVGSGAVDWAETVR